MQEIKFRGKRVDNGKWVEGFYVNGRYPEDDEFTRHFIFKYPGEWYVIYTGTLGQYTGLKDKNGKEIFEGDIIKHHGDITSRVFYNSAHCAFMLDDITGNRNKCQVDHLGSYSSLWIEVIGNIYENPELVGGAE